MTHFMEPEDDMEEVLGLVKFKKAVEFAEKHGYKLGISGDGPNACCYKTVVNVEINHGISMLCPTCDKEITFEKIWNLKT